MKIAERNCYDTRTLGQYYDKLRLVDGLHHLTGCWLLLVSDLVWCLMRFDCSGTGHWSPLEYVVTKPGLASGHVGLNQPRPWHLHQHNKSFSCLQQITILLHWNFDRNIYITFSLLQPPFYPLKKMGHRNVGIMEISFVVKVWQEYFLHVLLVFSFIYWTLSSCLQSSRHCNQMETYKNYKRKQWQIFYRNDVQSSKFSNFKLRFYVRLYICW